MLTIFKRCTVFCLLLTGSSQVLANSDHCDGQQTFATASLMMHHAAEKEMDELLNLFEEDAVYLQPFNPGESRRYQGKQEIKALYQQIFRNIDKLNYVAREFTTSADGKTVFIEAHGDMTVSTTGAAYKNTHVFRVDFDACDKVAKITQYANPLRIIEAFAPPANR